MMEFAFLRRKKIMPLVVSIMLESMTIPVNF